MEVCSVLPLLDVYRALFQRYRLYLTESRTAYTAEILVSAQIRILQRKAVTMYRRPSCAADRTNEGQPRKRGAFFQQIFGRQITEAEILPPGRLFFSTVPVEDIGEKPLGVLFGASFRYVHRHAVGQTTDEPPNPLLPIGQILTGVPCLRKRPV